MTHSFTIGGNAKNQSEAYSLQSELNRQFRSKIETMLSRFVEAGGNLDDVQVVCGTRKEGLSHFMTARLEHRLRPYFGLSVPIRWELEP
jgi:hypothetical protein